MTREFGMLPQSIPYALAAYLLGSVPFGKVIATRVARIDITKRGSGNIGATNVAREIGIKWGVLTLVLDALKGFLPVFLFASLTPHEAPGFCIGARRYRTVCAPGAPVLGISRVARGQGGGYCTRCLFGDSPPILPSGPAPLCLDCI